ncbi:hypothetical protein Q6D67_12240 [Haliea sp. E1-2-M8]|uniref:hypothetical protein n=1 Tax=Haliea sp. E1-2-M8 TaxID=3064706 RepID=UPI002726A5BD|nr:hypothetical protein [Haliea sp. E1-2-M8]MDO8862471.1 hypothetical protein [Haliea sp. E1-2-M8]
MATTRKRVSRLRGTGLDEKTKALFGVGCGWNQYGNEEVQRLWNLYGAEYRRHNPDSFAEMQLGPPAGEQ